MAAPGISLHRGRGSFPSSGTQGRVAMHAESRLVAKHPIGPGSGEKTQRSTRMNTPLGWFTAFNTLLSMIAIVAGVPAIRELTVGRLRSEEHTSELQSPYVISYAVFCLTK